MAMRCTCCETSSSAAELPSLQEEQHQQQHGGNAEQQAEQGDDRHQGRLFKRCFSLGGGPSSAIASRQQHSGVSAPAHAFHHIVVAGCAARAPADIGTRAGRWRARHAWQMRQKPLTCAVPRQVRIKFNADRKRPASRWSSSRCAPGTCSTSAYSTPCARCRASASCRERWRELAFADCEIALPCGKRMLRPMLVGQHPAGAGAAARRAGAGDRHRLGLCLGLPGAARRPRAHARTASRSSPTLARANLQAAGSRRAPVEVHRRPTPCSCDEEARYDAIVLTASLPIYQPRFERALRPGGRLFVVVGAAAPQQAQPGAARRRRRLQQRGAVRDLHRAARGRAAARRPSGSSHGRIRRSAPLELKRRLDAGEHAARYWTCASPGRCAIASLPGSRQHPAGRQSRAHWRELDADAELVVMCKVGRPQPPRRRVPVGPGLRATSPIWPAASTPGHARSIPSLPIVLTAVAASMRPR